MLALATWGAAVVSGRCGGDGSTRSRFVELGYQYAPVAMVSLLIGLGGGLFQAMGHLGLPIDALRLLKIGLFLVGIAWSLHLADRILRRQGLRLAGRLAALLPGLAGSTAVAVAWWPALFGV